MIITEKWLKEKRACTAGIVFFKVFNLEGLETTNLDICGDYLQYVKWFNKRHDMLGVTTNNFPSFIRNSENYSFVFKDKVITDKDDPIIQTIKDRCVNWCEIERDEQGNTMYCENSHGVWCKWTYDEKGNVIRCEDDYDYWCKWTYDENGNVIRCEDSRDYWCKWIYDENGNVIRCEDSRDYWCDYVYGDNGKLIRFKDNEGHWFDATDLPENVFVRIHDKDNNVVLEIKTKSE